MKRNCTLIKGKCYQKPKLEFFSQNARGTSDKMNHTNFLQFKLVQIYIFLCLKTKINECLFFHNVNVDFFPYNLSSSLLRFSVLLRIEQSFNFKQFCKTRNQGKVQLSFALLQEAWCLLHMRNYFSNILKITSLHKTYSLCLI